MLRRKHQIRVLIYLLIILVCAAILWHQAGYPMWIEPLRQLQEQLRLLIL